MTPRGTLIETWDFRIWEEWLRKILQFKLPKLLILSCILSNLNIYIYIYIYIYNLNKYINLKLISISIYFNL